MAIRRVALPTRMTSGAARVAKFARFMLAAATTASAVDSENDTVRVLLELGDVRSQPSRPTAATEVTNARGNRICDLYIEASSPLVSGGDANGDRPSRPRDRRECRRLAARGRCGRTDVRSGRVVTGRACGFLGVFRSRN